MPKPKRQHSLAKRPLLALAKASLASGLVLASSQGIADDALKVMLQGEDAAVLARLVKLSGGTITHHLPIIQAVGATMSRSQLDAVLATGKVGRSIDDLAVKAPDEPEPECLVGGALELNQDDNELVWTLYNKARGAPQLSEVEVSWPPRFGRLEALSFKGVPVSGQSLEAPGDSPVKITVPTPQAPPLDEQGELRFRFDALRADTQWLQRELSITAGFGEDCTTELIPGYEHYEDSYYPSVIGADKLHRLGITGKGVNVAVLDSGLWEHPNLQRDTQGRNRVLGRYDAINNTTPDEVFDESGHGTHMTSVLGHSGETLIHGKPSGSYFGIAPDSGVIAVKAFNETGKGDFLDIVRGIQWIVDHKDSLNIRVMNLSFAARPRWPYWEDPINQAIMKAWQQGITVVAAAGNEGPEPMTIGSPGNLPYIITVGAVTDSWTAQDRNDDYIPDFSSRGPTPSAHIKPDIVAPGGHMAGITRPGSSLTKQHPDYMLNNGDFVMTGTSQAAALVSGVAALLLQLEPELGPDDIKCKLISSAEPAIHKDGRLAYSPFLQGNGYISVARAITLGETGCGNLEMNITRDIATLEHYEGPAIMLEDGSTTLPGLEQLLSPEASEKGPSDNRRWGVKDHIERLTPSTPATNTPIDWQAQYEQERARIESLSR